MDVVSLLALIVAAAALVVGLLVLREVRGNHDDGALRAEVRQLGERQASGTAELRATVDGTSRAMQQVDLRMDQLRQDVSVQLAAGMRDTRDQVSRDVALLNRQVSDQLALIRQDSNRQLDAMRSTVDEKLTQTLNERLSTSFKQINDSLEAVHQGLGAMQGLAANVGDLKRVLSNVKTRGILGEVQLGAILQEVLAPEQYEENVAVKPGSRERVEYAVRIPVEDGGTILLPIDAKFPGDTYAALAEARESGSAEDVEAARKVLVGRIKEEAKDISSKYIAVPHTTNFALMFLPFEGLYAEVVSVPGLILELQRDYSVNVAGPSTMAAVLNSLQLSYQTLAIQKQTDQVLQVLQAVKAEFPKYQQALAQAKRQIDTAGRTVDKIITTRTNVMEKTLRDISLPGVDDATLEIEGELVEDATDE